MTNEETALSRRLVACRGWQWMPGMMRLRATPPTRRDHLRMEGRVPDGGDTWDYAAWPVIPDLTDAATAGALLSLLLTAARARFVVVEIEGDWRTRHAEVRLVDLVGDGYKVRAAFVDMPLGEAVALALLSLEDAPA